MNGDGGRSTTNSFGNSGRRRVQRILEKGRVNLSRSKSELGEQHKKMVSQLSRGRAEITEQNRRLLASIRSKKFGFKSSSSACTSPTGTPLPPTFGSSLPEQPYSSSKSGNVAGRTLSAPVAGMSMSVGENGHGRPTQVSCYYSATVTRRNYKNSAGGSRSPTPLRDLDAMLIDLGIDPVFGGNKDKDEEALDAGTLRCDNRLSCLPRSNAGVRNYEKAHLEGKQIKQQKVLSESRHLEQTLAKGYGEFEFIDEKDQTLTRAVPSYEDAVKDQKKNLSDEIFGELNNHSLAFNGNGRTSRVQTKTGATKLNLEDDDDDDDTSGSSFYNSSLVQRSLAILGTGKDEDDTEKENLSNGHSSFGTHRRPLSGGFRGSASSGLENHVSSFYATTARKGRNRRKRERRLSSTSFSGSYSETFDEQQPQQQQQKPWLSSNSSISSRPSSSAEANEESFDARYSLSLYLE